MEYDRYQKNHKFYIAGLISLILCLSFILFTIYITPFLIWNLAYQVPDLIFVLIDYFKEHFEYTEKTSRVIVGLMFFIPGLVTGLICDYVSNKIDNQLFKVGELPAEEKLIEEQTQEEKKQDRRESASLGLRILSLMVLCVAGVLLLQFLI